MNKICKLGLVLCAITAVTGVILGGVYTMTLEPIRATKERQKMEALAATLPGAKEFKQIEIKGDPGIITEINEGTDGGNLVGYNFTITPKGYGGIIEIVAGVEKDGELMDIRILNMSETPGLGAKAPEPAFAGQFRNKKAERLTLVKTTPAVESEIEAISGATITSTAVTNGVNTALEYWQKNLKEGAE